jgi:hypothetical protein
MEEIAAHDASSRPSSVMSYTASPAPLAIDGRGRMYAQNNGELFVPGRERQLLARGRRASSLQLDEAKTKR